MTTLATIEGACKAFSEQRTLLAAQLTELNDALTAVKRQHLPAIKRRLQRAAERQAELQAHIEAGPELFAKPRTVILHGIKVGYVKGKGGIDYADAERVCTLIQRHLPEQAGTLILTKQTPVKAALAQLATADLKRIGCTVVDTGDQVVIKAVDSEVDKMVDALLKDAVDCEAEVAA